MPPEAGLAPAGPANSTPQIFVAARYDIVTAGKNWVTVVASSGSFDRIGHAFAVIRLVAFRRSSNNWE